MDRAQFRKEAAIVAVLKRGFFDPLTEHFTSDIGSISVRFYLLTRLVLREHELRLAQQQNSWEVTALVASDGGSTTASDTDL